MTEVVNDVVDVLNTNAQAHGRWGNVLLCQLLGSHLRVRCGIRMNHEALYIGHIGQEREYLQIVNEAPCLFLATLNFESEDATTAIGEVFLIESMVGVRAERDG